MRIGLAVTLLLGLVLVAPAVSSVRAADGLAVTTTADDGSGSLRAQIAAAKNGDTITFDAALSGQTITLTSGEIQINKSLTIQGPGASKLTISGNKKSRIFNLCASAACKTTPTVSISGLTLSDGDAQGQDPGGGAILSTNSTVTLTAMLFQDNSAGKHVAGRNTVGGAIDSEATANDSSLGIMTIVNCTFVNNTAEGFGGAIEQRAAKLTIINSTFTGNSAPGTDGVNGFGGAIRQNQTSGPLGLTIIINSTIYANTAVRTSGISNSGGRVILKNSIVAGGIAPKGVNTDLGGAITSEDYNWIQNPAGAVVSGTTTHNITGSSPNLFPLADNGGPTMTMALPDSSKAIDAIPGDKGCNGAGLTTDQRNAPRPFPDGGKCDIGAYEWHSTPAVPDANGPATPAATTAS